MGASLFLSISFTNQNFKGAAEFDRKLSRNVMALLRDCLPIKLRALHICLPQLKSTPYFPFIVPVFKFFAGKHIRRRIVIHTGGADSVMMSLIKYGLGRDIIPFEVGGDYRWEANHAAWLANRLLVERRRGEALER
jgi:hypothetical protein